MIRRVLGRSITAEEFRTTVYWPRLKQLPPLQAMIVGTFILAASLINGVFAVFLVEAWDVASTGKVSVTLVASVTVLATMIGGFVAVIQFMYSKMRETDNTHIAAKGAAEAVVVQARKQGGGGEGNQQPAIEVLAAPDSRVTIAPEATTVVEK